MGNRKTCCALRLALPSKYEFEQLLRHFGGEGHNAYKEMIKDCSSGGFSVLLGGWRDYNGSYYGLGSNAIFWLAPEGGNGNTLNLNMSSNSQTTGIYRGDRADALSVRLVKD